MNLRDHDRSCGHKYAGQSVHPDTGWVCSEVGCPGGRVPTQAEINALAKPDYGAAYDAWQHTDSSEHPDVAVDRAIYAALGGGT